MCEIKYDNKYFKPKWVVHYNIKEVEMLSDFYTKLYYFRHKDGRDMYRRDMCCGIWELNGGALSFCSLRKLTLNEIDKIRNIYFEQEGFMF